jgi:hypothetical protein
MADKTTLSDAVDNYTGGEPLLLEVGSRDGQIFIRLKRGDEQSVACLLEPVGAQNLIEALRAAFREATS